MPFLLHSCIVDIGVLHMIALETFCDGLLVTTGVYITYTDPGCVETAKEQQHLMLEGKLIDLNT